MSTKTQKPRFTNNEFRAKAHQILIMKGYRCNWSAVPDTGHCLEHYSGPKGNVILQTYGEKDGVNLYADWAVGHTWEETEAAL